MTNWIRYGHAQLLADQGFRVIMPDLRAHGDSDQPHDPLAYPADVLVDDGFALLETLGLDHYDLGGYSLGARISARMVVRGARPHRLVLAGTGLIGLTDTEESRNGFRKVFAGLGTHPRGSSEWMAEAFLRTSGGDPVALEHILDAFVDTPVSDLGRITMPTLVLVGAEDDGQATAYQLADALPAATLQTVPGNHMSAVAKPALGQAIAQFLTAS
jgi:pimeloyl-ACP methyl ester carboxylesterase